MIISHLFAGQILLTLKTYWSVLLLVRMIYIWGTAAQGKFLLEFSKYFQNQLQKYPFLLQVLGIAYTHMHPPTHPPKKNNKPNQTNKKTQLQDFLPHTAVLKCPDRKEEQWMINFKTKHSCQPSAAKWKLW